MGRIFVKCRKCRQLLLIHPDFLLLTAHGEEGNFYSVKSLSCSTVQEDSIWFLQDSKMPEWISSSVEKHNWTKGKIFCPNNKCQARLGSFDLVSGGQCHCGEKVLPPIHLVKCKVDCRTEE